MLSRREFFSTLLGRARKAALEPLPDKPAPKPAPSTSPFALHRPPGAVAEADFLARCTRCGECAAACPHQAIVLAPAQLRESFRTPILLVGKNPCLHCPDMPCAAACVPRVLRADYPQKMGTARIDARLCLPSCTLCGERCPIPGAISHREGRAAIDPETCTGCGVCLHVCPAPRKAVLLTPESDRPPWRK
ncbi:MAG: 4Fe-4S binding protein [Armatimonadetes bacterium]|nr:4Fe-4S binding protein [Armatimonadota bacterium]